MTPTRGILWVSSKITQPAKLSDAHFVDWYENVHVDEVTLLSGVPAAARYEQIDLFPPDTPKPDWLLAAPWLTLYEMGDVAFRHSEEFKGLDGQSEPRRELLEKVFLNAGFEARFAEEVQWDEGEGAKKGPASLLISATLKPTAENAAEFDEWYRKEHIPMVRACPGYVRTRRYRIIDSSALTEFKRSNTLDEPTFLTLHEFSGSSFPMEQLQKADETEWSKRIIAGLRGMEAGFLKLRRVYGEYLAVEGAKGSKL